MKPLVPLGIRGGEELRILPDGGEFILLDSAGVLLLKDASPRWLSDCGLASGGRVRWDFDLGILNESSSRKAR